MGAKYLVLDTVLGRQTHNNLEDELLPTQVNGQEGISMPFAYELTMVREASQKGLIDPRKLIGTPARIGFLARKPSFYSYRTGLFANLSLMPRLANGLLMYKATILPAFAMLGRQVVWRIFEQQTVVAILNAVLKEIADQYPVFRFDTTRLSDANFAVMEYCVQWGESNFAFTTRLMRRYGIWYIFDNPGTGNAKSGGLSDATNNTLVLGVGRIDKPNLADISDVTIKGNDKGGQVDPHPTDDEDDPGEASELLNFRRLYEPPLTHITAANFNMLDPAAVVARDEQVLSDFDLLNIDAIASSTRQDFPAQTAPDVAGASSGMQKGGTLGDWALRRIQQEEGRTFLVTASSTNATLLPGRRFKLTEDENRVEQAGEFLVRTLTFSAYENSYCTTSKQDFLAFLRTSFGGIYDGIKKVFTQKGGITQGAVDLTLGASAAGLNNYLQNEEAYRFQHAMYPNELATKNMSVSYFWPFTVGGITQGGAGALISTLAKGFDDAFHNVFVNNAGAYSNSFAAIPQRASSGFLAPAPTADAAVARGPHLALVIGPDGTASSKGEIWADALGRVRIRFIWDIAAPRWDQRGEQPLKTDNSACWVRVSDGWAGGRYGTQFLPRIGNEVIVEFLDGDPERPIITGRLYNAASMKTSLPFPSQAAGDAPIVFLADLKDTVASDITRSGIKTRSMDGHGGADGFHLLRFDDKAGAEQLLIRSQGRIDETALASRYETAHGARHVSVVAGKDKDGNTVGGNAHMTIGGEKHLHVAKDCFTAVEGKLNATVGEDVVLEFDSNLAARVTDTLTLNAQSVIVEAASQISLKVGASFIVISPGAIYINSAVVNVNSGGSPGHAQTQSITDPADAAQADPGTPPNGLAEQKRAGGGTPPDRHRTLDPLTGPDVTPDHGDLNVGGFNSLKTKKPVNPDEAPPPYQPLPPPLPPPPGSDRTNEADDRPEPAPNPHPLPPPPPPIRGGSE